MTPPSTYANHVAMHRAIDSAETIQRRGMGSYELLTLLVIARHTSPDGVCFLSYATIAREAAFSRDTALKYTHKLIDGGFLKIIGTRSGGCNVYQVVGGDYMPTASGQQPVAVGIRGSSHHLLPPVGDGYYPVAAGYWGSGQQPLEVVPEVVKEVVKASSPINSPAPEKSRVTYSGNPARRKTGKDGMDGSRPPLDLSPVAEPQQRHTVQTDPAADLARLYLTLLGNPPDHSKVALTRWPSRFAALLKYYAAEDLKAVIEWAFLEGGFWRDKMFRTSGDPVDYFVAKVATIITSWKRDRSSAMRNTAQPSHANPKPALTEQTQSLLDLMFRSPAETEEQFLQQMAVVERKDYEHEK